MSTNDPMSGAKIAKPRSKHMVPAGAEPASVEAAPADESDGNFDPPTEDSALTPAEAAEAQSEVPRPAEVVPPAIPPTYLVRAGGRAWYRGQQIKFVTGETFTSETWDEHAIQGFRECGVTIEQTA